MTYLITIILCISGLVWKKSKILFMLLLVWMWILFGWNTDNVDYANYVYLYNTEPSLTEFNYEFGYRLICAAGNMLGLEYQQFLIPISAIGLILIASTIKKYSENPCYVLSLYLITTFFVNVIQIRSFLASAIIIFAIRYLVERSKVNNIIYVTFTLIASTIHFSALFYLAFVFITIIKKKLLIGMALFVSVCSYFIWDSGVVQQLMINLTNIEKVANWSLGQNVNSYLFNGAIQVATLILVSRYAQVFEKERVLKTEGNHNQLIVRESLHNYINAISLINWIMLTCTVLYLIDGTFSRIFTGVVPLNLIFFSNTFPEFKLCHSKSAIKREIRDTQNKILSRYLIHIIYAVIIFSYTVLAYADLTIIPILENNSLF